MNASQANAPQAGDATYTVQAVDGTVLPALAALVEGSQGSTKVRLDSGRITLGAEGQVRGEWFGMGTDVSGGNAFAWARLFESEYVMDGARVLIRSHGDSSAPDTAIVSGKMLTVRAQIFSGPSRERHVVVMTYVRSTSAGAARTAPLLSDAP